MNEEDFKRLLGAKILSEANDLKRTVDAMASEIGVDNAKLREIIKGNCTLEEAHRVIQRMSEIYPVNVSDIILVRDDCDHGVKIMRAEDSEASSRIFDRKNRNGKRTPYYEYRDTAMSRVAPFRPEWIRELRFVSDDSPLNSDVAYNNGHGLHQMTFFVGPVNFYWEVNGERFCKEMNTGDSNYITPFWPHSFTTRDLSQKALILAVTFGGDVRRAQSELYTLGQRGIQGYTLDYRNSPKAFAKLIGQHMANENMSVNNLMARIRAESLDLKLNGILRGEREPSAEELGVLARCLNVDVTDLMVPKYDPAGEVFVNHRSDSDAYFYPSDAERAYSIQLLARTTRMPLAKGFDIEVITRGINMRKPLCSSLHGWVFNYGGSSVRMVWSLEGEQFDDFLEPDDSVYIQPFVSHAFSNVRDRNARLCAMNVGGHVNLATQRELSYFSDVARVIEKKQWFD